MSALRFGLLGPLDIQGPDGRLPLRAGKQRVVLASLLLQAGQAVAAEQLLSHLWPDERPLDARAALDQYVVRLRQRLAEPELIRSTQDGYVIELPPECLDLKEFHRLVRLGQDHEARGDLAGAAQLLRQATDLWRGPPLADVPSEVLQRTEVPRLSELLLTTVEHRLDVALLLGQDAEIVAELLELTAEHPLREGFAYQLIAALYRSGRQTEAFEAYEAISGRLAEQLGTPPGPKLRALQQTMLSGGDLVLPSAVVELSAPRDQPSGPAPRQLPAVDSRFIGRTAEIEALVAALNDRPKSRSAVVALDGPGGLGKSALAVRAAWHVVHQFPDGQIYVDLQGAGPGLEAVAAGDALSRMLRALLGYEMVLPTSEAELTALFRAETADRRVLFLLDNAANEDQLRPLLPAGSQNAVLVTSRQPVPNLATAAFRVTPLSPAEALDLLSAILGADRVAAEGTAALELIESCGHNPLSLRIVAARLAGSPDLTIHHVADRLRAGHWRDLGVEDETVRSSLEVSYFDLVERAAAVPEGGGGRAAEGFRMIALLQTPEITAPVLGALLDLPLPESVETLRQLAELHLIETATAAGRFRMHDLLRLYSRDLGRQYDAREDRELALKRAFEWYVTAISDLSRAVSGDRWADAAASTLNLATRTDAVAWLDVELQNVTALARQHTESFREPLCRLVPMIAHHLQRRGRWREVEALIRLAIPAAAQLGDQRAEAALLANLSACNWRGGRLAEAEQNLKDSHALREATGDPSLAGRALHNLGWFYQRTGKLTKAIEYYERGLELIDPQADAPWQGGALHNLGEALAEAGRYAQAQERLEHCLAVRRASQDEIGISLTLVALGRVYAYQGAYDVALTTLDAGLEACRDIGHREDEWAALLVRAEVLSRIGDLEAAESTVTQALAVTRAVGNDYGEAAGQRQLSRIMTLRGHPTAAHQAAERSAALFADLSAPIDSALEAFLAPADA